MLSQGLVCVRMRIFNNCLCLKKDSTDIDSPVILLIAKLINVSVSCFILFSPNFPVVIPQYL